MISSTKMPTWKGELLFHSGDGDNDATQTDLAKSPTVENDPVRPPERYRGLEENHILM